MGNIIQKLVNGGAEVHTLFQKHFQFGITGHLVFLGSIFPVCIDQRKAPVDSFTAKIRPPSVAAMTSPWATFVGSRARIGRRRASPTS